MSDMPRSGGVVSRIQRGLMRHRALVTWSLITIGAIGVVLLGAIGFERHEAAARAATPGAGEPYRWSTRLYMAVQLFFLNSGGVPGGIPWQLEVARLAAVGVAAGVIAKGFAGIFRGELARRRLRRLSGHCVVCGLGRKGLHLVHDLVRYGPVVAVDRPENQAALVACQELGAIPLAGDCTTREVQQRAGVTRARRLIVTCGDDDTNIETVLTARDMACEQSARRGAPLSVHVHVFSPQLQQFLRRGAAIADPQRRVRVTVFDTFENAARQALLANPLDWRPIARPDATVAHLVALGVQRLGSSLALQAAKIGHFANGQRVRITLVDADMPAIERRLRAQFPKLDRVCDVVCVAEEPERYLRGPAFAAELRRADQLLTVALCLRSGRSVLQCALALPPELAERGIPVLLRLTDYAGLGRLLAENQRGGGLRLRPIGMLAESCGYDSVVDARLDRLAQRIQQVYLDGALAAGRRIGETPALYPWEELDEEFRDSCRHQADHIDVKLRALGCVRGFPGSRKRGAVGAFGDAQVELLAEMEHARWCAERHLAGWEHGPTRDDAGRRHPDLTPWSELGEDRRAIDRRFVRGIPELLAAVGEAVYPADRAP